MKNAQKGRIIVRSVICCILFPILISSCSTLSPQPEDAGNEQAIKDDRPVPLYYDFGDVLIPSDLKLQEDNTLVFRTPGLSAGVLSFKGRGEINAYIAFFESNMAKDNWKPLGSIKYPRTIMLFQKENRWCVISISERDFSKIVEIMVGPTMAPTVGETDTGLLK